MEKDTSIKYFAELYKGIYGNGPVKDELKENSNAETLMHTISDGLQALHEFGYEFGDNVVNLIDVINANVIDHPEEYKIHHLLNAVLRLTIIANRYVWDNEKIASTFRNLIDEE